VKCPWNKGMDKRMLPATSSTRILNRRFWNYTLVHDASSNINICPALRKGDPMHARPYPKVPWYYMPQIQGLMAVFDRSWWGGEWCPGLIHVHCLA